jgi:hypothetical protein
VYPWPGAPRVDEAQVPADLVITGCTFVDNWSGDEGGAVATGDTQARIEDSVFLGNRALMGGALGLLNGSHQVLRCRFERNRARLAGGAIIYTGQENLYLEEVEFRENEAEDRGGAVGMRSGNLLSLLRCWFLDNRAIRGGAVEVYRARMEAAYVLWYRQSASDRGGGLFVEESPGVSLTHCSWLENSAPRGGSLAVHRSESLAIRSSFLGDVSDRPVSCSFTRDVQSSCVLGSAEQVDCLLLDGTSSLEICTSFPRGACVLPQTSSCGVVGHAEEVCPPGTCSTPASPTTWGRIKSRYR